MVLFPALWLMAPLAHAASFDCTMATTKSELKVCGDPELSELDSQLGKTYETSLSRSADPERLRAAQRAWLRDVRERCQDKPCLNAAYLTRLKELSDLSWMTNDRERALCKMVTEAVNDGSVEEQFKRIDGRPSEEEQEAWRASRPYPGNLHVAWVLRVDYDGDGEVETLGRIAGGGSCATRLIVDLAAKVSKLYPPDDSSEERLRWASRGNPDHFLFVDGEPIVLTGNFWRRHRATLVSWLAPDGVKRALCYLGATPNVRAETVRQDDPALCQAVAEGQVDFLAWSAPVTVRHEALRAAGLIADTVVETLVDIDLDGENETLARLEHASGAGCGSYSEWLVELDPETHVPTGSAVNTHLTARPLGPMNDFKKPERWFSIQVLRFENKPYVLAKGKESDAAVYSLWNGKLRSWCEYTVLPQHQVELFYPVETWPDGPE